MLKGQNSHTRQFTRLFSQPLNKHLPITLHRTRYRVLAAEIMVVSKLVAIPELEWLGIHSWVGSES